MVLAAVLDLCSSAGHAARTQVQYQSATATLKVAYNLRLANISRSVSTRERTIHDMAKENGM